MIRCALIVLIVVAFIRLEVEGAKIKQNLNDDSYRFITFVGTKITLKNIKYFSIKMSDFNKEYFMRDCLGAAIGKNWVLTAAHCAQGSPADKKVILDHDTDPREITKYRNVFKCIMHPKYEIKTREPSAKKNLQITIKNDIGLLLVESMYLNEYGLISTLHNNKLYGKQVTCYRFRTPGYNDTTAVKKRKTIKIQKFKHVATRCEDEDEIFAFKFRWFFRLDPALCVTSQSGEGGKVQRGVSGGPLLSSGRIVGVATGTRPLQFHYTPVSPYIFWIFNIQEENDELIKTSIA